MTRLQGSTSPLLRRRLVQSVQLSLDAAVLVGAHLLAYELRFDFDVPQAYRETAPLQLPFVVLMQFAALAIAGVYSVMWRYIGLVEVVTFASAAAMSAASLLFLRFDPLGLLGAGFDVSMPLSVIVMNTVLAFGGVLGLRVTRRIVFRYSRTKQRQTGPALVSKPVLLVGAGLAGIRALEAILGREGPSIRPVGFIDDDPQKRGTVVHGVRVLGSTVDLPELIRSLGIDHVIITIARASRRDLRRIVEQCERIPVKARIIPNFLELLEGDVEAKIRAVEIEDLLGREPVVLDQERLTHFLSGKRIMVTGAGGSIGSEMCRQVARFAPETLLLVERCEFALFSIERELRAAWPDLKIVPRLADVGDKGRMRQVFARGLPHVVLHAAAHKHVPLMEDNPCEAIKNNIFGTQTTGELAGEYGAELFVLISTDKAVRPTSVMGATKRLCELVVQRLDSRHATDYIAVRFGNVLGSTGSVVPIFREQIARGGPVTVTHPDMVRYFMTIPEATQLVLQAGAMRTGSEIFVLDMGEPVRIVDLATSMIKLCGLKPKEDIEIAFSGIRPGEKMFEELSTSDEMLGNTHHPKILSGKLTPPNPKDFDHGLAILGELAERGDDAGARGQLARLLPEAQLTLAEIGIVSEPAAKMTGSGRFALA